MSNNARRIAFLCVILPDGIGRLGRSLRSVCLSATSLKITPAAYRHTETKITRTMLFISIAFWMCVEKYPAKTLDGSVNRFGNLISVK